MKNFIHSNQSHSSIANADVNTVSTDKKYKSQHHLMFNLVLALFLGVILFGFNNLHAQSLFSEIKSALSEEGGVTQNVSVGYGIPFFKSSKPGFCISTETKYPILENQLDLGLRLEGSFMGIEEKNELNPYSYSFYTISALVTSDYYFMKTKFRPFAGLGLGYYYNGYSGIDPYVNYYYSYYGYSSSKSNIGGMIRGGIEYGKLRISAEYNNTGKIYMFNPETYDFEKSIANYFTLKVGVNIGGGKRE